MKITNSDWKITNIGFYFRESREWPEYLEIYIEWWKIEDYKIIENLCQISSEMWAWWKLGFVKEQNINEVIWKEIIEKLVNSENFSFNTLSWYAFNVKTYEEILSLNINLSENFFSQDFLKNLIDKKVFFEARAKTNYLWNEQSKIYFHEMVWKYLEWIDINSCEPELLSDLIIDYHFNKISYNVFLDIKELFRYQIEKGNVLSTESLKIYRDILNIDKLSNEEKIRLHKILIWKNIAEMFNNDLLRAREKVNKEISDNILNHETIKQYKNYELSLKYWVDVYAFDWQPFYALAKVVRQDAAWTSEPDITLREMPWTPEYPFNRSFSLIWTEATGTWWWGERCFIYEWLTPKQITHVANWDSLSGHGGYDEYMQWTDRVYYLWSPSEILNHTKSYNELFIKIKWTKDSKENRELNDIKPIAISCSEITKWIIEIAKKYWIWIALINHNMYNKKNNFNEWHNNWLLDYMYPWKYKKSTDYFYAIDSGRRSDLCAFDDMDKIDRMIKIWN